jgi:hypothetical protein
MKSSNFPETTAPNQIRLKSKEKNIVNNFGDLPMKPKIEVLIECGTTYQPLAIAFSLLMEQYEIVKAHILTTHSCMEAVEKVVETFFPKQLYIIYGELVDANGNIHDQAEYAKNINSAIKSLKNDAVAVIASGTNWMTWQFSLATREYPTYVVKTAKAYEEKSFFPQNEPLAIASCGKIGENDGSTPIVYLQKLHHSPSNDRISVKDKTVKFLGHEIELTPQLAAMYAYLLDNGGVIDLSTNHTDAFNAFCEKSSVFDNERVPVDSFHARFKPNVSKINAELEKAHDLVKRHLVIGRENNKFFIIGWELFL